jgi:hypothetical protein
MSLTIIARLDNESYANVKALAETEQVTYLGSDFLVTVTGLIISCKNQQPLPWLRDSMLATSIRRLAGM